MNEELIEKVCSEFYEHGEILNNLKIIDIIIRVEEAMERNKCTLQELKEGIKRASAKKIINDNYNIGTPRIESLLTM